MNFAAPTPNLPARRSFVDDVLLSGWQLEISLEPDPADHQRVTLDGEPEQILDSPIIDVDVQLHGSALDAFRARHGALGRNRSLKKLRVHDVEIRVSVGAVHDRLEGGAERDRLAADVEMEVRRLRFALDRNPLKLALKRAGRVEDSADALDRPEIGFLKAVVPSERGCAGLTLLPWSECSARLDLAFRHRVGQRGGKRHLLSNPERPHRQGVDGELFRQLAFAPRDDAEESAVGYQRIDDDRRNVLGLARGTLRLLDRSLIFATVGDRVAVLLQSTWRDIDHQTFERDVLEAARTPQEVDNAAMDGEAVDLDERRNGGISDSAQPQRQAGPADGHRRKEIDAECFQLDGAVETILERRDDEFAQRLGSGAGRRDDGQDDERAHSRDCYPRRDLELHESFSGIRDQGSRGLGFRSQVEARRPGILIDARVNPWPLEP